MDKSKKTFWPYGIALFLIFMVCMIILTVVISLKVSPENDDAYFSTRQVVDEKINDILINQQYLEDNYHFYVIDEELMPLERRVNKKTSTPIHLKNGDEFILKLKVTDKNNNAINNALARVNITRFATSKFDKDLGVLQNDNGVFTSKAIPLEKGNWKAMIEFSVDDKKAYFEKFIIVD